MPYGWEDKCQSGFKFLENYSYKSWYVKRAITSNQVTEGGFVCEEMPWRKRHGVATFMN